MWRPPARGGNRCDPIGTRMRRAVAGRSGVVIAPSAAVRDGHPPPLDRFERRRTLALRLHICPALRRRVLKGGKSLEPSATTRRLAGQGRSTISRVALAFSLHWTSHADRFGWPGLRGGGDRRHLGLARRAGGHAERPARRRRETVVRVLRAIPRQPDAVRPGHQDPGGADRRGPCANSRRSPTASAPIRTTRASSRCRRSPPNTA